MSHLFDPFRSLPKFRELYGGKFQACCPAHDEKTPSFRGVLKDGRLLIKCYGCGADAKRLLTVMGLPWSALFEGGRKPDREAKDAMRQVREAREAEREAMMDEYFAIAQDLDLRDSLLAFDDWGEDGPPVKLFQDRAYMEWRLEQLAAELKI